MSDLQHWNWTEFCPTGLTPFIRGSNDLLPCFQQLCLQVPIYVILSSASAWYCGANRRSVQRNQVQLQLINVRLAAVMVLAILPLTKFVFYLRANLEIYPADVLVGCTQAVMWTVHFAYLLSLRTYGELSPRGPLYLNVVLTAVFALDVVWMRTSVDFEYWPWSLIALLMDFMYFLTFIPNGLAVRVPHRVSRVEEHDALLGSRYVQFDSNFNEMHLGHAQDEANFLSKFFFCWVNPLIEKGLAGNLKHIDDLFDLPESLNINRISERLQTKISEASSIFWALHKAFGREFYLIGIYRFISDVSGFAGPLLLGGLLSGAGSDYVGESTRPYLYAMGLFLSTLSAAISGTHFNWRMAMVGMKMRIGLVTAIYRKALEARGLHEARPEVLNLMSTDTDRIVNSCISFHSFWSIPFQLFTTLYLLYTQIGVAFVAGVVFAVLLIPINRWIAVKIGKYSEGLMKAKDARLSKTSETILGVKQMKLHAWEDVFIHKINDLRKTEVSYLAKRKYLDALCVYFWATTPVLMSLLTFGVSALTGNTLTAASTYSSVALLNMLIGPLNAFPWVLNGLVEAWVSVKRLQELFDLENLDFSTFYSPIQKKPTNDDEKPLVLQIKDATFEYQSLQNAETDFTFKLDNVSLDVKKGELVCIEGPVGGGKSTLMSAIVAAINRVEGEVCVKDMGTGFGYVAQSAWLQRGTIRENIVWGTSFDEQRYKNVIFSCALNEDLEDLGGDLVGVGESGRTLSGGQRARVSLARAVYQDKKIYLLDDVLSALDAHVANHVIKYCIMGILKDKTRIVVTHNRRLFYYANQILHVNNGIITKSDFMTGSFDLSMEDPAEEYSDAFKRRMSIVDLIENEPKDTDSIMEDESREYGNISLNVIVTYWKAMGGYVGFFVLFFVVLMQVTRNMSDAWLAFWVNDSGSDRNVSLTAGNSTELSITFYLGIYASLALGNSFVTLVRAFLFSYAGIKAAKVVHEKLLRAIIYTKFNFFDITSVGRILNRFSSDTYTVDDSLPFILNILLAQVVGLAGALTISLLAMPWLSLVVIPMVPVYLSLQYRYRHSSRDVKRLSSNALSPLYTHFTETLQGLTTIRAMRASPRFQRDFHIKLEESIKAQLTSTAAQQWLAMRLQLLGALLVGGAGMVAALTAAHETNAGMVGLAISYALSVTGLLGGVLNALAETEQEMIAVERIQQYLELEGEENADGSAEPPFGWPNQGSVCFKDVVLSYRDNLRPSLANFSLKTAAFERIAIVGRTGAGKTSVLSALLRVAPLQTGEVSIDYVNLKTLSMRVLRERVAIIPQEPFLFEGTIRENLDPRGRFIDSEIWNAITHCLSTPLVQSLGGLHGRLDKGGANLSAGQKQLLCLTRAVLKNSKVVCIDEGTSNLDTESEAAIQIALRHSFKSSTVLFIAHRLTGLQNMDRIIVMDSGQIVEQGTPKELAEDTNSMFYSMLQLQNNKDFIQLE